MIPSAPGLLLYFFVHHDYYSELFAYTFHHLYGLNCTGLRFFTVYGPRGRPDMAPFKFIERVYNGMKIQQYGDGNTSRDYTYIDDIVDGVVAAIDKPLGCEVCARCFLAVCTCPHESSGQLVRTSMS